MEQYEDDESTRRRVLTNGQVLAFIGGYWMRRPWLLAATVLLTLIAIGCELLVPRASQGLGRIHIQRIQSMIAARWMKARK
jgi:hypothetical protein